MKEHPILFSADMVRAIRERRKIQTRRVVKDPHSYSPDHPLSVHKMEAVYPAAESGFIFWHPDHDGLDEFTKQQYKNGIRCPYGLSGDRLWVRETWQDNEANGGPLILYRADGEHQHVKSWQCEDGHYQLFTDGLWVNGELAHKRRWKPSIHMPRWASRLTLAVTGVRVERVNDITAEDAIAEGILVGPSEGKRYAFSQLWDSINAKRGYGWDVNPWVWVIEFEVLEEQANEH